VQPEPSSFEIRVLRREAGESWTDEAVVVIDGRDRLAMIGRESAGGASAPGNVWIGLRPEVVVGPGSQLRAGREPRDAVVACCDCGIEDCGALIARITQDEDNVVWDDLRVRSGTTTHDVLDGGTFLFDADQYAAAVRGEGRPISSWEPTARRAAELVTSQAKGWRDDARRLRSAGAWAHGDDRVMLKVMLGSTADPDRATVRRTFDLRDGEHAAAMADRLMGHLKAGTIIDDEAAHRRPFGRRPGRS
jgi:hypothetical protein